MTIWFTVQLDDRPGALAQVAQALADRGVNITGIVGVAEDTDGALMLTTSDPAQTREVPLYAFADGHRMVVIGSRAGGDREPAWVGNLRANPAATLRVGREVRRVLARETDGAERDRLWALAAAGYPGYETYRERTRRRIPVIVLEPVGSPEPGATPGPVATPEPAED